MSIMPCRELCLISPAVSRPAADYLFRRKFNMFAGRKSLQRRVAVSALIMSVFLAVTGVSVYAAEDKPEGGGQQVSGQTVASETASSRAESSDSTAKQERQETPALTGESEISDISGSANKIEEVETAVKDGWVREDGKTYYYKNGKPLTGYQKIGNAYYCFRYNGAEMLTGVVSVKGGYYYFNRDTGKAAPKGWIKDNGKTYYSLGRGKLATGYQKIGNAYYCFRYKGADRLTGKVTVKGGYYYFNNKTAKAAPKGWITDGGKTYYSLGNGKLATGYQKIGNAWYCFRYKGADRLTGKVAVKGGYYYFNINTAKAAPKGWITDGDNKYYSLGGGKLATGWTGIGNNLYYFDKRKCTMLKDTTVNGFKLNSSGAAVNLTGAYARAVKVLEKKGWSLKAAYNYSAGLKYYRNLPKDGSPGVEWYANYGFTKGKGNCYVMASTFYYMAKLLGYDAHVMSGFVKGYTSEVHHSWVEINQGGKVYVYDPNFKNETGRNGFKIKYGQKGTWKYALKHSKRMN